MTSSKHDDCIVTISARFEMHDTKTAFLAPDPQRVRMTPVPVPSPFMGLWAHPVYTWKRHRVPLLSDLLPVDFSHARIWSFGPERAPSQHLIMLHMLTRGTSDLRWRCWLFGISLRKAATRRLAFRRHSLSARLCLFLPAASADRRYFTGRASPAS